MKKYILKIERHNGMMWNPQVEAPSLEEAVAIAEERARTENIDVARIVGVEPLNAPAAV